MPLGRWIAIVLFAGAAIAHTGALAAGTDARRLMESALASLQRGQNQSAIDALSRAIASKGLSRADVARAYFDRGVAFDGLGKTDNAISDYSEALRRDPALAPAYNNRGNAYRRQGKLAPAKRDYGAALKIAGANRQYPYYGLALIAEKEGDRETARGQLQKALAEDPGFVLATQELAKLAQPVPAGPQSIPVSLKLPRAQPAASPASAGPNLRPALRESEQGVTVAVQLGAFRDEAAAQAGWKRAHDAAGGALDGFSPQILTADLPGRGRFWRLRVVLPDRNAAHALCARLTQNGQDCILAPR